MISQDDSEPGKPYIARTSSQFPSHLPSSSAQPASAIVEKNEMSSILES